MTYAVRALERHDIDAVERIYKAHAGGDARRRRELRARVEALLDQRDEASNEAPAVALVGVTSRARVAAYLVGEARGWEFGSEPAGWIFALGVDPRDGRKGVGTMLLEEAAARFAELGVSTVRTMVRKDDVSVLRFFRSGRFAAGPYVELELDLAQRPQNDDTRTR